MNAVIFDLDGTMWDSRELIFAAWKQGLEGSTLPHVPLTPEFIHWQDAGGDRRGSISQRAARCAHG